MQRVIAYFFLLIIVNVVFFHPMSSVDRELHLFSDPVNSLAEFVVEVCLQIEDVHPGDERESESDHFNLSKLFKASGASSMLTIRHNYLLVNQAVAARPVVFIFQDFIRLTTPPPEVVA